MDIILRSVVEVIVIRGLELAVLHIERSLLDEDEEVISRGPRLYIAKKELKELEAQINDVSCLSFKWAPDIPSEVGQRINEARKTAFCLADQIDMYAIQGCSNSQLYRMKYDIGMRRIGELTTEIGELTKKIKDLKSQILAVEAVSTSKPQLSKTQDVPEDAIVRRDDEIKKIEGFLTGPHSVLFITGEQGSGKTTLMKRVYDSQKQQMEALERKGKQKMQVEQEKDVGGGTYCSFNQFSWVDIAETRSLIDLLKMVIKESNVDCDSIGEFEIIKRVHDTFKDRYCLIVLDNVQDSSVLYSLMTILKNLKWKIICLTRSVLCISGLEEYDSLQLFLSAAFPETLDIPQDSEGILREFHAKLDDATIRQCFLYCLAFPEISDILKDSGGIPTRKLIRLWTAEGYVQHSPTQSQEQEAECVLEELIKKNLLVVKKKGFDGEVLKCSVNERLRPLAKHMCELQKICKVVVDDADEASSPSRMMKCSPISWNIFSSKKKPLSDRYRMLAVHGDQGVKQVLKTLGKGIRLRSLLYFKTERIEHSELELSLGRTYMLLRTLELQGARLVKLPSKIGCLVCLRYLGLRNTQLEDLPSTLQRLKHLMCLDIRDTNISEVADVSQFREMRHLYLANSFRSHSVVIRKGLHSLSELQTLSGAAYGDSSENISFENLAGCLRKLSMKKTSGAFSKNICDAIKAIKHLQSLTISCDKDGQEFDLHHLEIGKNLWKMKLGGPMGNFRDLGDKMHAITFLYLWDSRLSIDLLDTLKGLMNLLVLSLFSVSTSEEMTCDNGYKKLKRLSIISMENLSEFRIGQNAMGNLEELVFAKCANLKRLPEGLDQLGSLREVLLTEMPPVFCKEAKDKLKDKVHVLRDALSHVVPSRAATGGS